MRKTKILGFSVPGEIKKKFEELSLAKNQTKSEFFRELLDVYLRGIERSGGERDLARILGLYWKVKSSLPIKTLVIGLAIIVDQRKVLIGARKEKDEWVENLTWVFPGGKFESLNFELEMERKVKEETGMEVRVKNLIASRIHPDSGFKPIQIIALYFHCEPVKRNGLRPGGDLKKLKWVKPLGVFKYFTTSTCDEVTKFLAAVEKW